MTFYVRRTLRAKTFPMMTHTATASVTNSLEFTPTGRGCGMGYGQTYDMRDGRTMGEGSVCQLNVRATQRQWRKSLASATKIVERVPEYQNRFGERGERVVAWFPPDEFGPESARIMWYDGGTCYLYISAPTLDIALEFERTNAYAY